MPHSTWQKQVREKRLLSGRITRAGAGPSSRLHVTVTSGYGCVRLIINKGGKGRTRSGKHSLLKHRVRNLGLRSSKVKNWQAYIRLLSSRTELTKAAGRPLARSANIIWSGSNPTLPE